MKACASCSNVHFLLSVPRSVTGTSRSPIVSPWHPPLEFLWQWHLICSPHVCNSIMYHSSYNVSSQVSCFDVLSLGGQLDHSRWSMGKSQIWLQGVKECIANDKGRAGCLVALRFRDVVNGLASSLHPLLGFNQGPCLDTGIWLIVERNGGCCKGSEHTHIPHRLPFFFRAFLTGCWGLLPKEKTGGFVEVWCAVGC